jgi:hypothetical protein
MPQTSVRARASFEDRPGGETCYLSVVQKEWLGLPAWFLIGLLGAWIATSKGRGGCLWFLLCAMLGPIGLLIAAVVPRADR